VRLHRRITGDGERDALLIHGFNCDSGDWWEVAPVLVSRGYRVVAVDLRGHGRSPRSNSYALADYVADVVETVQRRPALAIGHSLGGSVLAGGAERLRPERAIYLDPPWSPLDDDTTAKLFPDLAAIPGMSDAELSATLRRDFPRWSDHAIEVDVDSWRRWDPATGDEIVATLRGSGPMSVAVVPSLVVAADPSVVCLPDEQRRLRGLDYAVRVAPGLTHSLFRDDLATFLRTLDGWL